MTVIERCHCIFIYVVHAFVFVQHFEHFRQITLNKLNILIIINHQTCNKMWRLMPWKRLQGQKCLMAEICSPLMETTVLKTETYLILTEKREKLYLRRFTYRNRSSIAYYLTWETYHKDRNIYRQDIHMSH